MEIIELNHRNLKQETHYKIIVRIEDIAYKGKGMLDTRSLQSFEQIYPS